MSSLPVQAVLGIPALAVLVLALIPSYRLGSRGSTPWPPA